MLPCQPGSSDKGGRLQMLPSSCQLRPEPLGCDSWGQSSASLEVELGRPEAAMASVPIPLAVPLPTCQACPRSALPASSAPAPLGSARNVCASAWHSTSRGVRALALPGFFLPFLQSGLFPEIGSMDWQESGGKILSPSIDLGEKRIPYS